MRLRRAGSSSRPFFFFLLFARPVLPPGPLSWPRRDAFLLGALGVVLILLGIGLMLLVRRMRADDDETLEGP